MVIQRGGLVNNVALACQDGSDGSIGITTGHTINHVLELGQAFASSEVVRVLVEGDLLALGPLINDVRTVTKPQALGIELGHQVSRGVLTHDMLR